MLHHPLRLEGFLLSTVQEKTGSCGLRRRRRRRRMLGHLEPSAPREPCAAATPIPCDSFDLKNAAPNIQAPSAALRFITDIEHPHGLIARFSIRQRRQQQQQQRRRVGRLLYTTSPVVVVVEQLRPRHGESRSVRLDVIY